MNQKSIDLSKFTILLVAVLFSANLIFYYIVGYFHNEVFPRNTYLPAPITRFGDFYNMYSAWTQHKFAGVGYGLSYFPAAYLIVHPFTLIKDPYKSVAVFETIFVIFFVCYTYRYFPWHNVYDKLLSTLVLTLFTYPVAFTWHTGNLEAALFILVCLFYINYSKGNIRFANFFIAFAISSKLFPGVFLVLYLRDKKFKDLIWVVFYCAILSVVPLLIFKGGILDGFDIYLSNLRASQEMYNQLMIIGRPGVHFGHSLINGIRVLTNDSFDMNKVIFPYAVFAGLVFLFITLFIVRGDESIKILTDKCYNSIVYMKSLYLSKCLVTFSDIFRAAFDLTIPRQTLPAPF
ncbi:MAG: DUF2029 domain-containing protein [Nitrospira sp.]|nr:DUF2029 domain-containing protein [Nitrospira sp.]